MARAIVSVWVGGAAAAMALAFVACGGDSSPPPEGNSGGSAGTSGSGGSAASGGSGGTAASGGTGGSGATDAGSTDECTTVPTAADVQTCAMSAAPKATLIDWDTYSSSGAWGNAAVGDLTGGTSAYNGPNTMPLTLAVEGTSPDGMLHITGTIPANDYAGLVFWFGPCVDASTFTDATGPTTGLSIPLAGDMGGAALKLQVQTHETYPVEPQNMKGGCLFSTCETKWSDCMGPTYLFEAVPAMSPANLTWADFTGGLPETAATTNGAGVVGLQLQFECSGADVCAVDVTLGNISLTM